MNIAEELLARQMADKGISFERQYAYAPGRKYRADFAILHRRVLIEIQGGIFTRQAHGSISGLLADNARINIATLNNWRILRFSPTQVENGQAIETILLLT